METHLVIELLGFVGLVFFGSFLHRWLYSVKLETHLPVVGVREEFFSKFRASVRQISHSLETLSHGYTMYGKHGQPFVMPDPSLQSQVILPQEHISWLIRQSDGLLSQSQVRKERNAIAYLSMGVDYKATMALIDKIINPCLQRKLNRVQANVFDEIRVSVDDTFGLDETTWHELRLHESLQTIINRTGTRAFFGLPLCRNHNYLHSLKRFILSMGAGTLIIGQLPLWLLRSLAASVINIPLRYYKAKVLKMLLPIFAERIQQVQRREAGHTLEDEPEDFATQIIKLVANTKDGTYNQGLDYLAEQNLLLSFAALSSTAAAATNLLLDILYCAPELNAYETLRSEAASTFTTEQAWGDPTSLQNLTCTDSAIREGLRRNGLQIRGLLREVMPKNGITLPDGTHIARGTWVGVPLQAVHMDERFYTKPEMFDPFRFARMRTDPALEGERFDATQTSDKFLAFSYGRHACPGRWLVAQMLKLLIAYITLHYDIQPLEKRPLNTVFGDTNIPSISATIRVRRRKAS
ncbi:hypothetical protein JMJ35_001431 [Cladonia borealis]|uniref:Cytochrome P450 n=1 Tax=Cladonia borealis TaxID=184061 RepID=A0AA39R8J6_9LECA|nr:hypothetical protein JMJ35_001431 [Cladonia borealis]